MLSFYKKNEHTHHSTWVKYFNKNKTGKDKEEEKTLTFTTSAALRRGGHDRKAQAWHFSKCAVASQGCYFSSLHRL